jgi:hypothetical protein
LVNFKTDSLRNPRETQCLRGFCHFNASLPAPCLPSKTPVKGEQKGEQIFFCTLFTSCAETLYHAAFAKNLSENEL